MASLVWLKFAGLVLLKPGKLGMVEVLQAWLCEGLGNVEFLQLGIVEVVR